MIPAPPSTGIAAVLRQIPTLAPEDSVSRALSMLRYTALDTLPVVDSAGRLAGVITLQDLRPLLVRDRIELLDPVSGWLRYPEAVASPNFNLEDARSALVNSGETTLPVVDDLGHYFGVVGFTDLIEPIPVRTRPSLVGGMATPWGVYLTNGSIQAGVGNRALVATGLLMGALLVLALVGTEYAAHWLDGRFGTTLGSLMYRSDFNNSGNLAGAAFRAVPMLLFLLLIRALPLSQFHAAEHQAVHAIERGEPLVSEVVLRMPRVHPRCGTNIMAAALLFTAGFHALVGVGGVWLGVTDSALLAALVALLGWRRLGAFLQYYFTTRPAGPRHIASGVAAAEDLERKFQQAPPERTRILRRIWCMGLPQIMLGVAISGSATAFLVDVLYRALK